MAWIQFAETELFQAFIKQKKWPEFLTAITSYNLFFKNPIRTTHRFLYCRDLRFDQSVVNFPVLRFATQPIVTG